MIRLEFVDRIKKALGISKLNVLDARVTSSPSPEGRALVLLMVAPTQRQTVLIVQAVADSMLDAHKKRSS